MHITTFSNPPPWRGLAAPATRRHALPCMLPSRDDEFVKLKAAYRASGGIGCGESMALRMSVTGRGGFVDLARRIVAGQLFSFQWHDQFWMPMFQFDPDTLAQREAPRRVLDLLHGQLDGWGIAHWHVSPNAALAGRWPLHLLDSDLPAVLRAASQARPVAPAPGGTWMGADG